MNSRLSLASLLVVVLLVLAFGRARSSAQNVLTFTLTATAEQTLTDTTNLYQSKLVKSRVTTKEVLAFLGEQLGTNFPTGSLIDVDSSVGSAHVRGLNSFDLDVSSLVSVSLSLTNGFSLFGGNWDKVTQKESSTTLFLASIQVRDTNDVAWLDISGVATEKYTATAAVNNLQRITAFIAAPMSGSGTVREALVMYSGTVAIKAKGTYDVNLP